MKVPGIVLMILFAAGGCSATTWQVGEGYAFASIQQAIEVANLNDTVLVHGGHYAEGNILITRPVSIIGLDYPELDGQNTYEIMTVACSKVLIRGFRFYNGGRMDTQEIAAIKVLDGRHVRIEENQIYGCNFGIYLSSSDSCTVLCNDIYGSTLGEQQSGNGIHLWKCSGMLIQENYISGHRDGIYFEFVNASGIHSNCSENNIRYGLHFMFSHSDDYTWNLFQNNGSGVAVMYSRKVNMYQNTFNHNWGSASYGLLIKDISDSHIWANHFESNSAAICLEGASRVLMEENNFLSNGWALRVQASCDANTIRANNFYANSFDVSTNGSLVLNTFDGNYWDKYEGYDLDKDGLGDIPYRPVSLYAMVVEQMPYGLMLMRSFMVYLLDRSEKIVPSLTPENLIDNRPLMHPIS